MSINSVFATCGISNINKLHLDCMNEGNIQVEKERDKHVLEAVMSFAAVNTVYRSVKSFFGVCSIDRPNKQNILNLQLELFHLKHTVPN
jgi:hypothetical protein